MVWAPLSSRCCTSSSASKMAPCELYGATAAMASRTAAAVVEAIAGAKDPPNVPAVSFVVPEVGKWSPLAGSSQRGCLTRCRITSALSLFGLSVTGTMLAMAPSSRPAGGPIVPAGRVEPLTGGKAAPADARDRTKLDPDAQGARLSVVGRTAKRPQSFRCHFDNLIIRCACSATRPIAGAKKCGCSGSPARRISSQMSRNSE